MVDLGPTWSCLVCQLEFYNENRQKLTLEESWGRLKGREGPPRRSVVTSARSNWGKVKCQGGGTLSRKIRSSKIAQREDEVDEGEKERSTGCCGWLMVGNESMEEGECCGR